MAIVSFHHVVNIYLKPTKLREGNVFNCVCLFAGRGGVIVQGPGHGTPKYRTQLCLPPAQDPDPAPVIFRLVPPGRHSTPSPVPRTCSNLFTKQLILWAGEPLVLYVQAYSICCKPLL